MHSLVLSLFLTATAPVVTPDVAVGVTGQMTADRFVVPAVPASEASAKCQPFTATAAVWSGGVYGKTESGTASPYVYLWDGASTYYSTRCSFDSTKYVRCTVKSAANLTAATWQFCIGNDRLDATQVDAGGGTFVVDAAQVVPGSFVGDYCGATLNATKTCNADAVTMPNPLFQPGGIDLRFDRYGIDALPAPAGLTIDCTAEQLMGDGRCGGTAGVTFTKAGGPTLVDSPYFKPSAAAPERENLLPFSEQFDQWSRSGMTSGPAETDAPDPDGAPTAERFTGSSANAQLYRWMDPAEDPTPAANNFSVWLKSANGQTQTMQLGIAPEEEEGAWTTVTVTPQWQRFDLDSAPTTYAMATIQASGTYDFYVAKAQVTRTDAPVAYCGPTVLAKLACAASSGATYRKAVKFNGATDYFDAGDVGDEAGSFWRCVQFSPGTVQAGTNGYLFGKVGSSSSYLIWRGDNIINFKVWKNNTTSTQISSSAALVQGVQYTACFAYEWVTDGTSRLRGFVSSIGAITEATNGVGPPQDTTVPLRIGASSSAAPSSYFAGEVTRVTGGKGAPSPADLARLVASQMQPPLGVTHSRNQQQSIVSADGSKVFHVPANTGAVGPNGLQIYGQRISRILNNQRNSANNTTGGMLAASWTKRGTATVAAGCVIAPDGSCTAEEVTVGPAAVGTNDILQGPGGFAANSPLATGIWLKPVTPTGILNILNSGAGSAGGAWRVDLSALPSEWSRVVIGHPALTVVTPFAATSAGAGGLWLVSQSGEALSFQVWRPWQVEGAIAGPDAEVGGSVYTASPDNVNVPNMGIAVGKPWCVTVEATPSYIPTNAVTVGLFGVPSIGGANTFSAYLTANVTVFGLYDGAGNLKYVTGTAPAAGASSVTTFCVGSSGELAFYRGGQKISGASYGTGTGVLSAVPSTIVIGARSNGEQLNGSLKSFRVCPNETDPLRCERGEGLKVAPMFSPKNWCVRVKNAIPNTSWDSGAEKALLASLSPAVPLANSLKIAANNAGRVIFEGYDWLGARRYVYNFNAFTGRTPLTIIGCSNDGQHLLYINGTMFGDNDGSGGNPLISMQPQEWRLGARHDVAFPFDGTIESIDFNTSGDWRDF